MTNSSNPITRENCEGFVDFTQNVFVVSVLFIFHLNFYKYQRVDKNSLDIRVQRVGES